MHSVSLSTAVCVVCVAAVVDAVSSRPSSTMKCDLKATKTASALTSYAGVRRKPINSNNATMAFE
jgi:hypothetical protein